MKNELNDCHIAQGCRAIIILWVADTKMVLASCSRALTDTKLHNIKFPSTIGQPNVTGNQGIVRKRLQLNDSYKSNENKAIECYCFLPLTQKNICNLIG